MSSSTEIIIILRRVDGVVGSGAGRHKNRLVWTGIWWLVREIYKLKKREALERNCGPGNDGYGGRTTAR